MKPGGWLRPKLKLKLDAGAVEMGNAHLSGKFRGDAGKPAVARLLHLKKKNGFCGQSKALTSSAL